MKNKYLIAGLGAVIGVMALIGAGNAIAQNVLNYTDQGGAVTHIAGELEIESGGSIDIESGASLKVAGTAANLNAIDPTAVLLTGTSNQLTMALHHNRVVYVSTSGYEYGTNIDVLLPDGAPFNGFKTTIIPVFTSASGTLRVGMADGDGSELRGDILRFNSTTETYFRSSAQFIAHPDRIVLNSAGMRAFNKIGLHNYASGLFLVDGNLDFVSVGNNNGGEKGGPTAVPLFQSAATQAQSSFY